jgi:tryptophan synthase beta chain
MESHSISAGLDYAGVGPELANLVDQGRVEAVNVGDDAALEAFHRLSRTEGIIPALESSHALGYLEAVAGPDSDASGRDDIGEVVVVNVSGRGDKDLETVIEETEKRGLENAPSMDVFAEESQ